MRRLAGLGPATRSWVALVPSVLPLLVAALLPASLSAQAGSFGGGSRAHLFIYLAYAAAWIVIGLWVLRIGGMVRRLEGLSKE